jgi:lysophospholipase L1-like esterase
MRLKVALVLLVIGSTAVGLLAGEAALRMTLPQEQYYLRPPGAVTVFRPTERVMPGVSGDARYQTNRWGLRGDELEPRHRYRILAIGASTTECLYLDQSETWTELLQDALNRRLGGAAWVGNGGYSGHTTRHHLMAIEHLPLDRMEIDAVVLLPGVNDFTRRLARDAQYDPGFMARPDAAQILLHETFVGAPRWKPGDAAYKRTAIWRVLSSVRRQLTRREAEVQDQAGEVYQAWRANRQAASDMRDVLPDLESGLEEYSRNILKFVDTARQRGVRVILMTQPAMWRAGLPDSLQRLLWMGGVGRYQDSPGLPYYSAPALADGLDQYNRALVDVCRVRQVECLDLAAALEKDDSTFYDDVHFNENGARRVAQALTAFLLQRPPLTAGASF